MPFIEFKMHYSNTLGRETTPPFVMGGRCWYNPDDYTWVGWVPNTGKYYVPDSIKALTKEEFVQRMLNIHQNYPLPNTDKVPEKDQEQPTFTNEELVQKMEEWYDSATEINLSRY